MSFHLQISMQRDPTGKSAAAGSAAGAACVANVQISGRLSEHDCKELAAQVEAISAEAAKTIVIHLLDVPAGDRAELQCFCEWIVGLRGAGKPVHVAALQAEVYQALEEIARRPEWLMPFSGSETFVNRKAISIDGPSAAAG